MATSALPTVSLDLPPGQLGIVVQESPSGTCIVTGKSGDATPLLSVGDQIVMLNGLKLEDVEVQAGGKVRAWERLLALFGDDEMRVVVRRAMPFTTLNDDAALFVKKWEELWPWDGDLPLPLDAMMILINQSGTEAVRKGLSDNHWILPRLLAFYENEEPSQMIEIVRILLDACPEAAGVSVPSDELFSNFDPAIEVNPLHAACQNPNTPNEVIEMLLDKSTAGLDHMVVMGDVIVEWCGDTMVAGTPLHYYLYWGKGDVAIVKRLVEACPETLKMKDMTTLGLTPLHTILRAPSKPDLEVVKFFVQYNASLLRDRDAFGQYPIHLALGNKFITIDVIEFLLENTSTNVWEMRDRYGDTPMHSLLQTDNIKEALAIDILRLFQRLHPNEAFFDRADAHGKMPIHHAASAGHGAAFCRALVELAPGCERIPDDSGSFPLHGARHIDTVKYLVDLYPESIYLQTLGETPFHYAVRLLKGKYRADIVRYFLELDPSFASTATVPFGDPLHSACTEWDLWGRLTVVKILFDCYPRAILVSDPDGKLPVDLARDAWVKERVEGRYYFHERDQIKHEKIISFLETQHPFVDEAGNSDALNTPDANGMLLLHRALLEKNISLGTVEMIVNGTNPEHVAAVRAPNPLHLACANCSPDIIQYLSGVYPSLVNSVDDEGCNILHFACKGGNIKAVTYLLKQHAPLVSETNSMNLLPIHLLCDKAGKEAIADSRDYIIVGGVASDKEKREYVGLVWKLLLAYPAAVSSAVAHFD